MSATARVGTAMAAGYVLGRFKKLRLALIVGSAMANKNVRASGLGLLQQGTKGLRGSPDALRISDQIKSRLIASGRAAAVGVAASGIDRLSDRLHERSDAIRPHAADEDEYDEGDEADEAEDLEPEDEYDDEPEDEAEDEPEDEDEPDDEPADEEPGDDYDEDEDEEPDEPRHQHRSPRRRRAAAPVES